MIEDIINEVVPKNENDNNYSHKEKVSNNLYTMLDNISLEIIEDIDLFKKYLEIQGIFDRYSVGNALLITAQAPNAKQLNQTKQSMKDKEISLIEPFNRKSKNGSFNSYKIYASERIGSNYYKKMDNKTKLKAFLNECPVDVKPVDNIDNGLSVYWNNDMKLLYIKRGTEYRDLFQGIARELSREELGSKYNELEDFKCKCISYIILKKYDLDTSNYKFDEIPKELKKENAKEIREELNELRECAKIFSNRVDSFLFKDNKKQYKKNKDYSR